MVEKAVTVFLESHREWFIQDGRNWVAFLDCSEHVLQAARAAIPGIQTKRSANLVRSRDNPNLFVDGAGGATGLALRVGILPEDEAGPPGVRIVEIVDLGRKRTWHCHLFLQGERWVVVDPPAWAG